MSLTSPFLTPAARCGECRFKYENKFLTTDLKGKICNFSSTKIPALRVLIRKKTYTSLYPCCWSFPLCRLFTLSCFLQMLIDPPLYYLQPHYHTYHFCPNFRLTGFVITLSSTGTSLQTIPTTANLPLPRSTTTTIATTTTTAFHPPLVFKRRRKVS